MVLMSVNFFCAFKTNRLTNTFVCTFHGLGPITRSKLISETMNTGDRPIARLLPAQDSTTQKNAYIQDTTATGHWDRLRQLTK